MKQSTLSFKKLTTLAPFLIVTGVTLVFFWRVIFLNNVLWSQLDTQYLFYPVRSLVGAVYHQGKIPTWFPWIGSGFPVFSLLQFGVLYPVNIINAFIVSFPHSFNTYIIGHFLIAAFGAIFFAKTLNLSKLSQTLCGIAYGFGGVMFTHAVHADMLGSIVWLPWMLALIEQRIKKNNAGYLIIFTLIVTLQLLAGHPQTFVIAGFTVILYLLIKTVSTPKSLLQKHPLWYLGELVGTYLMALILSAVQLIPSYKAASESARTIAVKIPYFSNSYRMTPSAFVNWMSATFFGQDVAGEAVNGNYWGPVSYQEAVFYIGLPMLFCAFLTPIHFLRDSNKRSLILPFIVLAAITVLLSLGDSGVLYFFWRHLPGMNGFRVPARFLWISALAVMMLAGIGLDHWLALIKQNNIVHARAQLKQAIIRFMVLAAFLLILTTPLVVYRWIDHYPVFKTILPSLGYVILALTITILLLFLYLKQKIKWPLFALSLVLLLSADLFFTFGHYLRTEPIKTLKAAYPYADEFKYKAQTKLYSMPSALLYEPDKTSYDYLLGNLAIKDDINSQNFYAQLILIEKVRIDVLIEGALMDNEQNGGRQALNFSAITHLQVNKPLNASGLVLLHKDNDRYLYKNTQALPQIYFVNNAIFATETDLTQDQINRLGQGKSVLLLPDEESNQANSQEDAISTDNIPTAIQVTMRQDNKIELNYQSPQAGYVVLANTYDPGWQAFIDGQETKVLQANIAYQAIQVPQGEHQVRLIYRPWGLKTGILISGAGVLLLFILSAVWYFRRKKHTLSA